MTKYTEAKKAISDFYDERLIEVIARIRTDNLNGNGVLDDDEVREALIYHLDIDLYNRMEFNYGEFIYRDIIHALRNTQLPINEINNINQQRREDFERILDIEILAYDHIIDAVANVMIRHGYIGLEATNTEAEMRQEEEFRLVRRILIHELAPDENDPVIAVDEIAKVLEIFRGDLENLRRLIAVINRDRDAEMQVLIDQMINPIIVEDTNSMDPQVNISDGGSLTSSGHMSYTSDGLSPIMLQHDEINLNLCGVCSSSSIIINKLA